jgi:AcrR family transcriptional regulator
VPGTRATEAVRREQIISAAFELAASGGLRAMTVRDVARKAGMSTGLVIFHFGTKDRLVLALLDWVLANTMSLVLGPELRAIADPLDRLTAVVRQEMARLSREPRRNRVFFEFWSEGSWNRPVRTRMQRDLDRYRAAFRPLVDDVLERHPERFSGVDAAGLTTAVVSFIKGCAVQSMIEPRLDVDAFLAAVESLLAPHSGSSAPSLTPS